MIHPPSILLVEIQRLSSYLSEAHGLSFIHSPLHSALGKALSEKPAVVLVECGPAFTSTMVTLTVELFAALKSRFRGEILTVVALTAPEQIGLAGEILFGGEHEVSGSVDTFLVFPPRSGSSDPTPTEQLRDIVSYTSDEYRGSVPAFTIPPLGSSGWAQSIGDPRSRALWMKWLPRYAKYTNENPVIVGETGTGKTNLALALHRFSSRTGKFVTTTPRDFSSPDLMHAELFGAVTGAYTGAIDKWGLVRSAEGGTLFVDELQSIDRELQGKLITFIEQKIYRRVGGAESILADVRFIFASNRALEDLRTHTVLREDFAYRLERMELLVPPLRSRRLDIGSAVAFGLAKIRRQRPSMHAINGVTAEAYRLLFSYSWPGNLRQLENFLARACEYADINRKRVIDGEIFHTIMGSFSTTADDLHSRFVSRASTWLQEAISRPSAENVPSQMAEALEEIALELTGDDIAAAATLLKTSPALLSINRRLVGDVSET